jgi:hypothetical protein
VLLHLLGRALHRFAAAFARTPVLLLHPIRGITQLATQLIELTLHVSSRLVLATELVELTLPLLEEALLFLGRLFAALFALAASFEEPFFLFLRVLELALARAALAVFGHRAQILDQLARRSLLACPSRELLHLARGLVELPFAQRTGERLGVAGAHLSRGLGELSLDLRAARERAAIERGLELCDARERLVFGAQIEQSSVTPAIVSTAAHTQMRRTENALGSGLSV